MPASMAWLAPRLKLTTSSIRSARSFIRKPRPLRRGRSRGSRPNRAQRSAKRTKSPGARAPTDGDRVRSERSGEACIFSDFGARISFGLRIRPSDLLFQLVPQFGNFRKQVGSAVLDK